MVSALLDALAARIRPAAPALTPSPAPGTFAAAMPSIITAVGIAWLLSAAMSAVSGIGGIVMIVGMGAFILSQPSR